MRKNLKETLNIKQIIHHYKVEIELARKLRNSRRDERIKLYSTIYNELFLQVTQNK